MSPTTFHGYRRLHDHRYFFKDFFMFKQIEQEKSCRHFLSHKLCSLFERANKNRNKFSYKLNIFCIRRWERRKSFKKLDCLAIELKILVHPKRSGIKMRPTVLIAFVFGILCVLELVQSQTTPANVFVENVCICVTKNYCGLAGGAGGNTDGAGNIDPRIMTVCRILKANVDESSTSTPEWIAASPNHRRQRCDHVANVIRNQARRRVADNLRRWTRKMLSDSRLLVRN